MFGCSNAYPQHQEMSNVFHNISCRCKCCSCAGCCGRVARDFLLVCHQSARRVHAQRSSEHKLWDHHCSRNPVAEAVEGHAGQGAALQLSTLCTLQSTFWVMSIQSSELLPVLDLPHMTSYGLALPHAQTIKQSVSGKFMRSSEMSHPVRWVPCTDQTWSRACSTMVRGKLGMSPRHV